MLSRVRRDSLLRGKLRHGRPAKSANAKWTIVGTARRRYSYPEGHPGEEGQQRAVREGHVSGTRLSARRGVGPSATISGARLGCNTLSVVAAR